MTRAELIEQWNRLVDGDVSRIRVHEWADPLVRANEASESLVMTGLQTLHGATGKPPAQASMTSPAFATHGSLIATITTLIQSRGVELAPSGRYGD